MTTDACRALSAKVTEMRAGDEAGAVRLGRTRWDAMSEAAQDGWAATARLAVLLLVRGGVPCGVGLLVIRFAWAFIRVH